MCSAQENIVQALWILSDNLTIMGERDVIQRENESNISAGREEMQNQQNQQTQKKTSQPTYNII